MVVASTYRNPDYCENPIIALASVYGMSYSPVVNESTGFSPPCFLAGQEKEYFGFYLILKEGRKQ